MCERHKVQRSLRLFLLSLRYAVHRDVRALGLDMFRQFLIMQVRYLDQSGRCLPCCVDTVLYHS